MTDLKEFLSLLETTVKASRLSSSKVTSLSDQSKKLESSTDSEFVSTFLRLNKALSKKSTNRISSLYVFDAIARANKGVAGREGLLLKMEGVVDSWVNGMCEDGKGGVWTEGRDKTRKIVDIWTKSSTFPAPCLDRLSARLAAASSAAPTPALPVQGLSPPKPVMSPALPPLEEKGNGIGTGTGTSTTPPVPPGSLPLEIQKLLGIAAPNGASSNPLNAPIPNPAGGVDLAAILAGITKSPNSVPAPPVAPIGGVSVPQPITNPLAGLKLDPNQLAALATLASRAQAPPPPQSTPYPPQGQGHGSPPYPGQYDRYGGGPEGPGPSRRESEGRYGFRSPSPPGRYPGRRFDDRPRSRSPNRYGRLEHGPGQGYDGPSRSGSGPGPGGYDEPSHRRQGSRDGEAPTYGQVRSSRDRRGRGRGRGGPPGGGGRDEWDRESRESRGSFTRDTGPNVRPPLDSGYARRPPPMTMTSASDTGSSTGDVRGRVALPTEPGKDEFGRDLPASVEKEEEDGEEDMALDDSDDDKPGPSSTRPSLPGPGPPQQTPQTQAVYPQMTPSNVPQAPPATTLTAGPTLETFDRTTFNPADPGAWATLAQAWRSSLGRDPNQMELMEWLATGVVGGFGAMMGGMSDGGGGGGTGGSVGFGGGFQ